MSFAELFNSYRTAGSCVQLRATDVSPTQILSHALEGQSVLHFHRSVSYCVHAHEAHTLMLTAYLARMLRPIFTLPSIGSSVASSSVTSIVTVRSRNSMVHLPTPSLPASPPPHLGPLTHSLISSHSGRTAVMHRKCFQLVRVRIRLARPCPIHA